MGELETNLTASNITPVMVQWSSRRSHHDITLLGKEMGAKFTKGLTGEKFFYTLYILYNEINRYNLDLNYYETGEFLKWGRTSGPLLETALSKWD